MYEPGKLPLNKDSIFTWLEKELEKISEAMRSQQDFVLLRSLAVEPKKRRKGMIVYADGVSWNPGSGEGVYRFNGASWILLG